MRYVRKVNQAACSLQEVCSVFLGKNVFIAFYLTHQTRPLLLTNNDRSLNASGIECVESLSQYLSV